MEQSSLSARKDSDADFLSEMGSPLATNFEYGPSISSQCPTQRSCTSKIQCSPKALAKHELLARLDSPNGKNCKTNLREQEKSFQIVFETSACDIDLRSSCTKENVSAILSRDFYVKAIAIRDSRVHIDVCCDATQTKESVLSALEDISSDFGRMLGNPVQSIALFEQSPLARTEPLMQISAKPIENKQAVSEYIVPFLNESGGLGIAELLMYEHISPLE